ncbi:MAG: glycosyltransferase [Minisyncoccia bacterium]
MKVLSIGMDRKLFEEGSSVLERSKEYAEKMEELHIVVFSLQRHNLLYKKYQNLHIYPTNSYSRITFLFGAYFLGKKIIEENNFLTSRSIITVQDPMTIVGYCLSKKFKLPIQLQIHTDIFNSNFKKSLIGFGNFWYSGLVQVPLTTYFLPRVSGIRVVSQSIKDSILTKFSFLDRKIEVLPIYVDINHLISSYPGRDIKKDFPGFNSIILMASRLSKEKRIDIALNSFKKVLSKFPLAGLVICGEGLERENLIVKAKELDISKSVVFLPWQSDLMSYYKTCDVFLLTSEYEGYGMTLIEAGASGCPVVTTKVGVANSNLFEDGRNSYVCEINDTDCLSEKITILLDNNTKRDDFKRNLQKNIKNYSKTKEEYVDQYVSLLEKL